MPVRPRRSRDVADGPALAVALLAPRGPSDPGRRLRRGARRRPRSGSATRACPSSASRPAGQRPSAPPPAVRVLRRRPGGARRRPRPAGGDPERPDQPDDDHPDHRRLGQHVLDRHPAEPAPGGRAGRGGASSDAQGSGTQIGIVAFSGFAEVVQAPTNDQAAPARRPPEPDDRPADGDRQRAPGRDRRDRRDRPERRAAELDRRPPGRPGHAGRRRAPTRRTSSSC